MEVLSAGNLTLYLHIITSYIFIKLSLHVYFQVFPASGEVPCGGALPPKVIPGPSPLLHTLIRCLIKVDNIVQQPVILSRTHGPSSSTIQLLN